MRETISDSVKLDVRIDFHGRVSDAPMVRAGFIGCGSHAFRNVYSTLQFVPVQLVATCDLDTSRAEAFAKRFGAEAWYGDHHELLERDDLDAVFIVTSMDERGRPRSPDLAVDCMEAGCHVWMEKPPAAVCTDIERMQDASAATGKIGMVGLKKMFAPANRKARDLSRSEDFGEISLVRAEYPQDIPTVEQMTRYLSGESVDRPSWFLDHLCHPGSLLQLLLGPPETLYYRRARSGAGVVLLTYSGGDVIAELALTHGNASTDGLERTMITSGKRRHIVVDNNTRVTYHRLPVAGYGDVPDFYTAPPEQATSVWHPEFSLGQLYNKGSFLLGYYGELAEFAAAVLEGRQPCNGTLDDAWHVTRLFEAFARGPDVTIELNDVRPTR